MKGKIIPICTSCLLLLLLIACEKSQDDFVNQHLHDLLVIQKPIQSVPADGKSMVKVKAKFKELVDKPTVTFACSNCQFSNNSDTILVTAIRVQDTLEAEVTISPSLEAKHDIVITCLAQDFNDTAVFDFDTAYAETLQIEADRNTIESNYGSTLGVKIYLKRNIGKPSLGQSVRLYARKSDGSPIGDFRSVSIDGSDSSGLINAIFELRDEDYLGEIMLTAEAKGASMAPPDHYIVLVVE